MTSKPLRVVLPIAAAVLALVVLLIGVFPSRALVAQRGDVARAEARLDAVAAENARMVERIEALGTDAEVERIAREQYGLVRPGEEAYAILPVPPPPPPVPDAWPFRGLADRLGT